MSKIFILKIVTINLLLMSLVSCTKDSGISLSNDGIQKSALMGEWKMIEEVEYNVLGKIICRNYIGAETCPPEVIEFLDYDLVTQVTYNKVLKGMQCESGKIYKEYQVKNAKLYVGYGRELDQNSEYEIDIVSMDDQILELEHKAEAKECRGYDDATVMVKAYYYRTK